jgi:hypothetical protein
MTPSPINPAAKMPQSREIAFTPSLKESMNRTLAA